MATYDDYYIDEDFEDFTADVELISDKSARRKLDDYFEIRRLKQLLKDSFDDI